jgi:hypothetical protein
MNKLVYIYRQVFYLVTIVQNNVIQVALTTLLQSSSVSMSRCLQIYHLFEITSQLIHKNVDL